MSFADKKVDNQTTETPSITSKEIPNNRFIHINKYLKYDLQTKYLVSAMAMPAGTRILIEVPLFLVRPPSISNHPLNSLYLYQKFEQTVNAKLQSEILNTNENELSLYISPLKYNTKVHEYINELKLNYFPKHKQSSAYVYSDLDWQRLEKLLNVFHAYSLSLKIFTDPYLIVHHRYLKKKKSPVVTNDCHDTNEKKQNTNHSSNDASIATLNKKNLKYFSHNRKCSKRKKNKRFHKKYKKNRNKVSKLHETKVEPMVNDIETETETDEYTDISSNCESTTTSDTQSSSIITVDNNSSYYDLGKALFRYTSHMLHSCHPSCRINVIDDKGTIEIRTLTDIPSAHFLLTRNFLDETRGSLYTSVNKDFSYFLNPIIFDSHFIPCNIRNKILLIDYKFICKCPKCQKWDICRGFKCNNISNCNGCQGILLSNPPYHVWQCQTCRRRIDSQLLTNVLSQEKVFINKLKGLQELINYGFQFQDNIIFGRLLSLLNACEILANNHWIVLRLFWLCFEERLSKDLNTALIYLKRHLQMCESINDYRQSPTLSMAAKYELLADLMDNREPYKLHAIKKALQLRKILHGERHVSVKRCKNKIRFYQTEQHN